MIEMKAYGAYHGSTRLLECVQLVGVGLVEEQSLS